MASGAPERIGYVLEVDDRGTPVVTNFANRAAESMGKVEGSSNRAGRALDGVTEKSAPLAASMKKSQAAAFALAGGISQVGARASMAMTAVTQLVIMGFNPLGVAVAAASVAIGLLISKESEAAEVAKAHAAALREVLKEARELQSERWGALDPERGAGLGAADMERRRQETLDAIAQAEARMEQTRSRITTAYSAFVSLPAGLMRAVGLGNHPLLEEWGGRIANFWTRGDEKGINDLAAGLGKLATETTKAGNAAKDAAKAYEKLWGGQYAPQLTAPGAAQPYWPYSIRDALEANQSPASAVGPSPDNLGIPMAPGVLQGDPYGEWAREQNRLATESSPWYISGTRAADGFIAGIGDTLTTGIMTGELDMVTLAESLADLFVRSFIDALLQATLGNALRSAFQTLFLQAGTAIGAGPETIPGASGEGPVFAPQMVVQPAPVVSEQVLAAAGDEAMRGRVTVAIAGPGRRGRR